MLASGGGGGRRLVLYTPQAEGRRRHYQWPCQFENTRRISDWAENNRVWEKPIRAQCATKRWIEHHKFSRRRQKSRPTPPPCLYYSFLLNVVHSSHLSVSCELGKIQMRHIVSHAYKWHTVHPNSDSFRCHSQRIACLCCPFCTAE